MERYGEAYFLAYCTAVTKRNESIKTFFSQYEDHPYQNTWCIHTQKDNKFKFPCFFPTCDKIYQQTTRLHTHIKEKHSAFLTKSKFQCTAKGCILKVNTLKLLEDHITQVHGAIFLCKKCGTPYGDADILRQHKQEYNYILQKIQKLNHE